ncbi:di-trans,poly-cis-decaprenylcistransferase [Candidatus Aerophobetes bacterium]|uniref:Isoprenyl transferase n=1 Tax=Aerophobetes bacterium TaxID=2030807 RepID=A0A2A4YH77_UNCAE|nr:MAG: di-trans,poly-cis-decaprenylcistransferase [Candidatus Aerophobetes bacterium]
MNSAILENRKLDIPYCEELDLSKVPKHIAFIMDGNRRWAKKKRLPIHFGHYRGAEVIDNIVSYAADLGVKVITVYAFSTENWSRSLEEVNGLMQLFKTYLRRKKKSMLKQGVKLTTIGSIGRFSISLQKEIKEVISATEECEKIQLVLALNYGSRDEITRAVKKIIEDVENKKISKQEVTENLISGYLDTADVMDPELLIRTSGESRLSNFLLWQLSYTEVMTIPTLWPDFGKKDLLCAILEYQKRKRRFGE